MILVGNEKELEVMGISIKDFLGYTSKVKRIQSDVEEKFNGRADRLKLKSVDESTVEKYIETVKSDWYNEFADTDLREDKKNVNKYIESIRTLHTETSGIRYWIIRDGKIVGGILINIVFGGKEANIGYFLYPEQNGKGIMTNTLKLLTDILKNMCKETIGYEVTFKVQRNNLKSWNVMKRLNYELIDVQKGKHCNNLVYKAR